MPDHAVFLDKFHRINPTVPLGISEYGVDCNPVFYSETPKVNDYTEEFQCQYHETVYPYMRQRDFVWGSYVWNMFDFVSAIRNAGGVKARNLKGLVTHDRKTKKDAFYYYQAQWSEELFIHITGKRFVRRAADEMKISELLKKTQSPYILPAIHNMTGTAASTTASLPPAAGLLP